MGLFESHRRFDCLPGKERSVVPSETEGRSYIKKPAFPLRHPILVLRQFILIGVFCFAASSAFAQLPFGLGLKGGVALTDAYQNNMLVDVRTYSDARDYIIGPFAELRLPFGFGVEADALYRPLSFATQTSSIPGIAQFSTRYSTWEFPILAKYRFKFPIVRPYIDAGPSFRTTTSNTSYLSNHGFAIGGGLDVKVLFLHVSPEIRYTRWGSDSNAGTASIAAGQNLTQFSNQGQARSNVNQVEFLVGISF